MTTKDRITEEALTLFAEKGYKGTSVKNIADAVGIKDAVYAYFRFLWETGFGRLKKTFQEGICVLSWGCKSSGN